MTTWFQLPAEIRTRIYEYAFTGLVLRPFSKTQFSAGDTHGKNGGEKQMQPYSIVPLTVCKRWNLEVTPYLLTAATFDFTAHPGDPPNIASPTAYELMRHVVILETHCFNTDWVSGVFGKMSQVQTMTIRKLRKVGVMKEGDFDGPDISQAFAEKVKVEPLQSLFCGYRFDHVYVKDTLKGSWPNRKILLEGYLWLDRVDAPHSHFQVDLDTWMVSIEGLTDGGKSRQIQSAEPARSKNNYGEEEDGMFIYLMSQYFGSLQTRNQR